MYTKHEDALPCCFRYKWNAEHSLYEVYKKGIQLEPWLKTCLRAGLRNFSIATDLYINAVRDRSHLHLTIRNIAPKLSLSLVYVLIIFAVQRRVSIQCKNYTKHLIRTYIYIYGTKTLVGHGLLIIEASRSLPETPHLVGLLSPTHTLLPDNTQHIRNRHSFPSGFRTPQSQQSRGRRPTP